MHSLFMLEKCIISASERANQIIIMHYIHFDLFIRKSVSKNKCFKKK